MERVFDGVYDRGSGTVHGKFADSFCAIRAVNVAQFLEENANGGKIGGGGHDVVGHLAVLHAAIPPNHFFIESKTDGLRDAADNLSRGENGMKHFADFLERDEVFDGNTVGGGVDGDFGDVNGPRESGIGGAAVGFFIPNNVFGLLVLGETAKCSLLRDVSAACGAELFGRIAIGEQARGD